MTPGTKLGLILAVAMFAIVGGYFLFVPGERPPGLGDAELPMGEASGGGVDAPELIRADELAGGLSDDPADSSASSSGFEDEYSTANAPSGEGTVASGHNDLVITWPLIDERGSAPPELPDREVASFDWDSLTQGLPPSQESRGSGGGDRARDAGSFGGPNANEPAAIREGATGDVYIVQHGDSFWSIARAWYGDGAKMELIAQANPNANPDRLQIGQRLTMPPGGGGARANFGATTQGADNAAGNNRPRRPASTPPADAAGTHTVREGDTLVRIARQYFKDDSKWQAIYAANRALIGSDPDKLKLGTRLVIPR